MKYYRYESRCRASITRILTGWQDFARDNRLKPGDVCIFSLLKGTESSFEVVIFRDSGSSKAPISPGEHNDRTGSSFEVVIFLLIIVIWSTLLCSSCYTNLFP